MAEQRCGGRAMGVNRLIATVAEPTDSQGV
jgi:hypothetical protein